MYLGTDFFSWPTFCCPNSKLSSESNLWEFLALLYMCTLSNLVLHVNSEVKTQPFSSKWKSQKKKRLAWQFEKSTLMQCKIRNVTLSTCSQERCCTIWLFHLFQNKSSYLSVMTPSVLYVVLTKYDALSLLREPASVNWKAFNMARRTLVLAFLNVHQTSGF